MLKVSVSECIILTARIRSDYTDGFRFTLTRRRIRTTESLSVGRATRQNTYWASFFLNRNRTQTFAFLRKPLLVRFIILICQLQLIYVDKFIIIYNMIIDLCTSTFIIIIFIVSIYSSVSWYASTEAMPKIILSRMTKIPRCETLAVWVRDHSAGT